MDHNRTKKPKLQLQVMEKIREDSVSNRSQEVMKTLINKTGRNEIEIINNNDNKTPPPPTSALVVELDPDPKKDKSRDTNLEPATAPSSANQTKLGGEVDILERTKIINNVQEAELKVQQMMSSNEPIALDLEGINLGLGGKVTLVQIATVQGDVLIFDVWSKPEMIRSGENSILGKLLCSTAITKVIHACHNDVDNLSSQFRIRLQNYFDTQKAHRIILKSQGDPVKDIGFNELCQLYGTTSNPLKDKLKKVYRRNPRYWATRPMTEEMTTYAAYDVFCLPNIFQILKEKILEISTSKGHLHDELWEHRLNGLARNENSSCVQANPREGNKRKNFRSHWNKPNSYQYDSNSRSYSRSHPYNRNGYSNNGRGSHRTRNRYK